ncbi:MAG: hypothetical protein V1906_03110, partial [Candidatus Woesearchaeota archaeon]
MADEQRGEPIKNSGNDIKFIIDRTKKEQEDLIANIIEIVKKKPYPDRETMHLASFINALFQTAPYVKSINFRPQAPTKKEEPKKEEQKRHEPAREAIKPLPEPPMPHRVAVRETIDLKIEKIMKEKPALKLPELNAVKLKPAENKYAQLPQLKVPELKPAKKEELKVPELKPAEKKEEPKAPEIKVQKPAEEKTAEPRKEEKKPEDNFHKREYVVSLFNTPVGILIAADEATYKVTYRVIEPVVSDKVLNRVKDMIKTDFQKNYKILDDMNYIEDKVQKACKKEDIMFTEDYPNKIRYYLKRDLTGFRRIDAMMQDNNVLAIYVDGVNKPVIVEFKDYDDKIQSNVTFTDPHDLNVLITKIAKVTNTEISESKPILDTTFEGFKIQATMGVGGSASKLIIRKVMF